MKEGMALVIFSGGQDSSTCLFWAKNNFESVEAISFYYGQRHASELKAAEEIASLAEIPLNIMELPLLNFLTENSLTRKDIPIGKADGCSVPNTLVEGRNLLFLTYAAIYAKSRGIAHLVTGVSQTDYSGYPDCRNEFIVSANATLNLAMEFNFKIHTPLMFLSKCQTWMMAEELGVLEIIKEKTVTCYEGRMGEGCGECPSCLLRSKGLNEYYTTKANERKI